MASRGSTPFPSLRTEGALLPADFLARLTEPGARVEGVGADAYHLVDERIHEATSRAWARLRGIWTAFRQASERLPESDTGTSLTRERWLLPLFQELGYGRLPVARGVEAGGKAFAVSHLWQHTPIHLVSFRYELHRSEPGVRGLARGNPHGLVQELLNRSDAHLWGMVSNGLRLRLLRDGSALARQAFVEWDLEYMLENELYPDFVVLWMVCHQSRVEADRPEECWLERWARAAQEQGVRAYEELRRGVKAAIEALGRGYLRHSANGALRERVDSGGLDRVELYRQLLRMVYRLIFLMVAEERGLLHPPDADPVARRRYADFFSVARLRRMAERRAGSRHADLAHTLRLVVEKLGSEAGSPELGLPALGGFLFSAGAAEALDGCEIDNLHLLDAVRALAFVGEGGALRPVDFGNLGSRELGSVYESLLELEPEVDARAGGFDLRAALGNERKTTGSYYTPEPLIQALLDSALEPVLAEAARAPDAEAAILRLRVCDPACGSGHFLISAAHRMAHRLASIRSGGVEPSPEVLRHALRDVIGHCLYGVDLNPMAVELCKLSLWMEALEPGKPLAFLENRVRQGNSLLGATPALLAAGIPDEAFTPADGDDREYARRLRKMSRDARKTQQIGFFAEVEPVARHQNVRAAAEVVEAVPDDTFQAVRRKEGEYARMVRSSSYVQSRLWADAWCAAFVWRKTDASPPPVTEEVFRRIERDGHSVAPGVREEVRRLAGEHGFFHWHLEFPDVFRPADDPRVRGDDLTGWIGGFDVVLGNPPWGSAVSERTRELLRCTLQVARERFDNFAGFLELAIRFIARPGRRVGLVLPDIVLLKSYMRARRIVLDEAGDLDIRAWGMVFPGVTMEAVTISGVRDPGSEGAVVARVRAGENDWVLRSIPRQVFRQDKLLRFNLYYDVERQALAEHLATMGSRFGDAFVIREGVHTGNRRDRLFVPERLNDHCLPLLRSGNEVEPLRIHWKGGYIDLSPEAIRKGEGEYFNLGRPEQFQPGTLLVRRTGDRVIAAVNDAGYYASNNLFTCGARDGQGVDVAWAALVLSSPVTTWLFRYTQPREGKAFSELKIVHLEEFPLPPPPAEWDEKMVQDVRVEELWPLVESAFGLTPEQRKLVLAASSDS